MVPRGLEEGHTVTEGEPLTVMEGLPLPLGVDSWDSEAVEDSVSLPVGDEEPVVEGEGLMLEDGEGVRVASGEPVMRLVAVTKELAVTVLEPSGDPECVGDWEELSVPTGEAVGVPVAPTEGVMARLALTD